MLNRKDIFKASHKMAKYLVAQTENYSIAFDLSLKKAYEIASKRNKVNARREANGKKALKEANEKMIFGKLWDFFKEEEFVDGDQTKGLKNKETFGVPEWILDKNTGKAGRIYRYATKSEIVKETEKAVEIVFTIENPAYENETISTWIPKSVLA